jgi:long-chain acyl-CoA synthetase
MVEWWGPVFVEYFGFTEGGLTLASTAEWLDRPGTVGRPLPHQEVLIVGPDGTRRAPGVEGLVHFRFVDGSRFAYFEDQAKTEQAYGPDGSFTAGDVGWLDEDGYLYISGRQADTIVCAGVNVYPAEVEAVVDAVDGVRDVAVVGGPDDERGEQVVAVIEADPGVDADSLHARVAAACERSLASYKRPRTILLRASLPRDPTGKLLRGALRDELWHGRSGFAARASKP